MTSPRRRPESTAGLEGLILVTTTPAVLPGRPSCRAVCASTSSTATPERALLVTLESLRTLASFGQFGQFDGDFALGAAAENFESDAGVGAHHGDAHAQLVGVLHGLAVEFQNDVALQQAAALRRAVGADVAYQRAMRLFLAEGLGHGRRDVLRDDPQISARHFPVLADLVHDGAGQVHRNGEADALIAFGTVREDGGIDADQFTAIVDQRSTGVAGVDRRVGLDEIFVSLDA